VSTTKILEKTKINHPQILKVKECEVTKTKRKTWWNWNIMVFFAFLLIS